MRRVGRKDGGRAGVFFASVLALLALQVGSVGAQSCSFGVSNVNFGTVNPLSNNVSDTTASLTYNCRNILGLGLSLRICPNILAGSGGTSGNHRLMMSGSNTLAYQLYQDPGRSIPWGATSDPTSGSVPAIDTFLPPLSSTSGSIPIYARIPAGQSPIHAGTYLSSFAGMQVEFTYERYTLFAPNCSTVNANPTQASFSVIANVSRSCTVSAQMLNFGNQGVLTSNVDANSSLSVNCTPNLPYSVALNGGLSNTQPTQRRMTLGSNAVVYGLYINSARTIPWGDAAAEIVSGTGAGVPQILTVYGRVVPQTTPPPGIYTDTVVVTVTY